MKKLAKTIIFFLVTFLFWLLLFWVIVYLFQQNISYAVYKIFYPDWPNIIISNLSVPNSITYPKYSLSLLFILVFCILSAYSHISPLSEFSLKAQLKITIINIFSILLSFSICTLLFQKESISLNYVFFTFISLISILFVYASITALFTLIKYYKLNKQKFVNQLDKQQSTVIQKNHVYSKILLIIAIIANLTFSLLIALQNFRGYDDLYHVALIRNLLDGNSIFNNPFYENIPNTYVPGFHFLIIFISIITSIPPEIVFNLRFFIPSIFGILATHIILKDTIKTTKSDIYRFGLILSISWLNGFNSFGGNVAFPLAISYLFLSISLYYRAIRTKKKRLSVISFIFLFLAAFTHLEVAFYGFIIFTFVLIFLLKAKETTLKFKIFNIVCFVIAYIPTGLFVLGILISHVRSTSFMYFVPLLFLSKSIEDKEKSKQLSLFWKIVISLCCLLIVIIPVLLGFHGFGLESPVLIGLNAPLSVFSLIALPLAFIGFINILKTQKSSKYILILAFIIPYLSILRIFFLGFIYLINPTLSIGFFTYIFFGFHSYSSIISLFSLSIFIVIGISYFYRYFDYLKKKLFSIKISNFIIIILSLSLIANQTGFFMTSYKHGDYLPEDIFVKIEEIRDYVPAEFIIASDPHTSYLISSLLSNKVIYSAHATANNLNSKLLRERMSDLLNLLISSNTSFAIQILQKYDAKFVVLWKFYPEEMPTDVNYNSSDIIMEKFNNSLFTAYESNNFYIWEVL